MLGERAESLNRRQFLVKSVKCRLHLLRDISDKLRKYDESLKTIEDKDGSIKVKTGIIVTLSILLAVLAGALVFGFIVLMRYVVRNRKLKKNIAVANEHNELKTQFIGNISEQMKRHKTRITVARSHFNQLTVTIIGLAIVFLLLITVYKFIYGGITLRIKSECIIVIGL